MELMLHSASFLYVKHEKEPMEILLACCSKDIEEQGLGRLFKLVEVRGSHGLERFEGVSLMRPNFFLSIKARLLAF